MFDLSIPKLLVLAVIALVIFGPNELPKIASQAGRAIRDLRKIAEAAKNDLREGLGPEFADFEIEDLNPKRFVQKHLFDDINARIRPGGRPVPAAGSCERHASGAGRAPAVRPRRDLNPEFSRVARRGRGLVRLGRHRHDRVLPACLPVLVLGVGTALAHMLRADAGLSAWRGKSNHLWHPL